MSLFFPRSERRSKEGWVDFGHGGPTESQAVARATRLGPVFASLRHIVDYTSSLPVDAYQGRAGEARIPAPMPELLRRLENPLNSGIGTWFGQAAYALAADGNAVGYTPNPETVTWLHRTEWSFDELSKQWYVLGRPVPRDWVVHIPWIVPPGRTLGLAPIEHYASIVSAGLSAQEYADMKRGGGLPPTTLKNTTQVIDHKAAEVIEARLSQRFAQGRPFVFGRDWEFGVTQIPPNHSQFIETMKLTASQIAAIYGLDPTEVGGQAADSMTYSNEEMRQIKRAANMRPYLVRLEQGVSRLLDTNVHVAFDIDATMRVDAKVQTEVIGMQVADGRMSVNEARAVKDMPPVAGGDFHNIPTPASKAPALPGAKETK